MKTKKVNKFTQDWNKAIKKVAKESTAEQVRVLKEAGYKFPAKKKVSKKGVLTLKELKRLYKQATKISSDNMQQDRIIWVDKAMLQWIKKPSKKQILKQKYLEAKREWEETRIRIRKNVIKANISRIKALGKMEKAEQKYRSFKGK